jgi:hypothetical protein
LFDTGIMTWSWDIACDLRHSKMRSWLRAALRPNDLRALGRLVAKWRPYRAFFGTVHSITLDLLSHRSAFAVGFAERDRLFIFPVAQNRVDKLGGALGQVLPIPGEYEKRPRPPRGPGVGGDGDRDSAFRWGEGA